MLSEIMATITKLIEDQVNKNTCIKLSPHLQEFYDKIISVNRNLEEAEPNDYDNSPVLTNRRRIKRNDIFMKTEINAHYELLQNLMEDFDKLSPSEQMQIYYIKTLLKNHILLLDAMESTSNQFIRKTRSSSKDYTDLNRYQKYGLDTDVENKERFVSGKFEKLIKTAELIRKNSLFDQTDEFDSNSDDFVEFDDYN